MNKHNPFETYFKNFIIDFGGTVLAESLDGKSADYLFPKQNVIAELKTLMEDSSTKMDTMLKDAVLESGVDFTKIPIKTDSNNLPYVDPSDIPDEVRQRWMNKLFQEIERNVSSASKQIEQTKERSNLPNARGIILVANESNTYHNNPKS